MSTLENLLSGEFDTPEAHLALELAREDQHLVLRLIEERKLRGLTQEEVADILGLTQATISAFEKPGNDPRLSTVRRYARAVSAMVRHMVEPQEGACSNESEYIAHVSTGGISTTVTAAAIRRSMRPVPAPVWRDAESMPVRAEEWVALR